MELLHAPAVLDRRQLGGRHAIRRVALRRGNSDLRGDGKLVPQVVHLLHLRFNLMTESLLGQIFLARPLEGLG